MGKQAYWRVLPFHRGSSAAHVKMSDALLRKLPVASVWWHAAEQPTLILGAGQREPALSGTVVRRSAGGTAVLATRDVLGLDIALPHTDRLASADILESYRWLGAMWVEALRLLGVETRAVSIEEARHSRVDGPLAEAVLRACFGGLSPYEVVIGTQKLVGFAQVRRQRGVLLQSGVHLKFDAEELAALLLPEDAAVLAVELRRRAVGLEEVVDGACNAEDVQRAFAAALKSCEDIELLPGAWTSEELTLAGQPANLSA